MGHLQVTTTLLGCGLAAVILFLIRRDHLYLPHGIFWLLVAIAAVVLGLAPRLINGLARWVGVAYPPALLFLMVGLVLFLKALHADMVNTRIERQLRRLNQELGVLLARDRAAVEAPCDDAASTAAPADAGGSVPPP